MEQVEAKKKETEANVEMMQRQTEERVKQQVEKLSIEFAQIKEKEI